MMEALVLSMVLATSRSEFHPPQYRGFHYSERAERFLTCVAARESGFRWDADGPWGSGIAQWVQPSWDHWVTRAGFPEWAGKRAAAAPRYVQWATAFVMVDPYPKRKGLEGAWHWDPKWALTVGKTVKDCR